ncbi:MAG: polyphenol oxidase family protein [Chloroflexota bacterium]|nr:polyphenol oxidase family protein [Chloroflexota bacterium]
MRSTQLLTLLPFPGPRIPEIVAGLTPARDDVGATVDMGAPGAWLHHLTPRPDDSPWRAHWIRQVHGRVVLAVGKCDPVGATGTADALVTDQPGVLLVTRHADCAPVLFWDPHSRALGLAHSGRRGTLAYIVAAVITALSESYGTLPRDLQVSIGAGIRACCYEIQEDVASEVRAVTGGEYLTQQHGGIYFDGPRMIADQCRAAGVEHVYGALDGECTCCGTSRHFSYRRDGTPQRFAAIAGIPS